MELLAAERELSLRMYHWAVREIDEQLPHSYPRIREMDLAANLAFFHILWPLTWPQERELATALLKALHAKAVEYLGDPPTRAERDIAERYYALLLAERSRTRYWLPERVAMTRRQLATAIHKALPAALPKHVIGKRVWNGTTVELDYELTMGDWRLNTWVSTGSGTGTFDFTHQLFRVDDNQGMQAVEAMAHGHHRFSYGWLLGNRVSTEQTVSGPDEVEERVAVLARVMASYLQELPQWLKGLNIDDPG